MNVASAAVLASLVGVQREGRVGANEVAEPNKRGSKTSFIILLGTSWVVSETETIRLFYIQRSNVDVGGRSSVASSCVLFFALPSEKTHVDVLLNPDGDGGRKLTYTSTYGVRYVRESSRRSFPSLKRRSYGRVVDTFSGNNFYK